MKVGIGLPVFNGSEFIEKTLNSIANQSFKDYTLIILDNASTDSTFEICARFSQTDSRIKIIRNEYNIGAVNNFIKVAKLYDFDYFMWAASDDRWHEDYLKKGIACLEKQPSIDIVHTGVSFFNSEYKLVSSKTFTEESSPVNWSWWELANRCAGTARGGLKMNYAMYGIFRHKSLMRVLPSVKDTILWDRLFVILMALVLRFGYINDCLYWRTVQDRSVIERYPQDSYSKIAVRSDWWRFYVIFILIRQMSILSRNNVFAIHKAVYLVYVFSYHQALKFLHDRFPILKVIRRYFRRFF